MYIEQRFYDNGSAEARLHETYQRPDLDRNERSYDAYMDEVDDLEEWISENMECDDTLIPLIIMELKSGEWVDITIYC